MNGLQRKWGTATLPESSIVLIGLVLTVGGLLFRGSNGIAPLLTAIGIGLLIAGTVYIAARGSELTRLTLAFVSLVAVQLVTFGDVVQWVGGALIGIIGTVISYSRLSK